MGNVKKADRRAPLKEFYCVVCGEPISADRVLRRAVTCTKTHATILKNERRKLRDLGAAGSVAGRVLRRSGPNSPPGARRCPALKEGARPNRNRPLTKSLRLQTAVAQ